MPEPPLARSLTALLSYAATPTFVLMAVAGAVSEQAGIGLLCGSGSGAHLPASMPAMYLLMALFHTKPWIWMLSERLQTRAPGRG